MTRTRNGAALALLGLVALVGALLLSPFSDAEAAQSRGTPQNLVWVLDVDGRGTITFSDVSGLGSEHEVVEHRVVDASGNEIIRKIPGRLRWNDITLERGITSNMDMWTWRSQVADDPSAAPSNGSLRLVDGEGQTVAQWNFERGWPSRVSVIGKTSGGNAVVEHFTLVVESLDRVPV